MIDGSVCVDVDVDVDRDNGSARFFVFFVEWMQLVIG